MRRFEFLIVAMMLLIILGLLLPVTITLSHSIVLIFIVSAAIILHLALEGYRWQMVPAYSLTIVVLFLLINQDLRMPSLFWRIGGTILGIIFFAIAVGLPIVFPIFKLPTPKGAHLVGTQLFTISANRQSKQDIIIQAWYPAGAATKKLAPYLAYAPFPWDWLRRVPTHAYADAPLSDAQSSYPILIFNHGGGFMAVQNTVQMQELASHGYVVISISHLQDSAVFVYPDGTTNGRSLIKAWQDMKPVLADNNNAFKTAAALINRQGSKPLNLSEKRAIMQQIFAENHIALEVINRRVNETHTMIAYLERVNTNTPNHPFANKLDMNRLGIFGHSNGGAVAVNVAMNEPRIKAVINMDGYIFGDVFNDGLPQPFMTMSKEGAQGRDDVIYEQAQTAVYALTIQGANHFNFMDIYLWFPLFNARYLGSINPQRAIQIINSYSLAFFDKYLKNKASPLLEGPSTNYPEVHITSRTNSPD